MNPRAYWRFVLVVRQFLPLALAWARDRRRFILFGRGRSVATEVRRERARALRSSLVTLGPTFIKLGQLLSTRPDVLPPEYVEELSSLQDRVPPAPFEDAKAVIEAELGPIEERFDDFDTDPISGASLGQVYRARVDGEPVAVKVRRPGVETLVAADLRAVRWTLPVLLWFVDDARAFSLETVADEFDRTIREEMDYGREASMLREIRECFADQDDVVMPPVVASHSTDRVLTMGYVEGVKITDVDRLDELGIDRTALAERLQRAYLAMIADYGVFHADPHPGNLAVQPDGTLVFYDFGMSGRVDPFLQQKIVEFYTAVANQDIDAILDALIEMGTLSPEADRQVMGDVMELAIADARGEDIEQYRVRQIVQQVEDTIYEFPLRLPPNLALVLRVATVVEGVCVTLDPDFDFIAVASDYLREEGHLAEGAREYARERGRELRDAAESMVRVPPKLEGALDRIEREDLHVRADIEDSDGLLRELTARFTLALLLASGVLSTALVYAQRGLVPAGFGAAFTAAIAVALWWSFRERGGIRAQPQFTRQNLRSRRETDDETAALAYTPRAEAAERGGEPTAESVDGDAVPEDDGTATDDA